MLFIAELDVFGPLTAGVGIDQLAKDGCEQMPDMWIRQVTMSIGRRCGDPPESHFLEASDGRVGLTVGMV